MHGEPVPDPRFLLGSALDLAALENGGVVTGCSNMFYSSPTNLISPGEARVMGEGWETARRRDDGNDWVQIALAGPGVVALVEIDTSYFVGNAPGWARDRGCRIGRRAAAAYPLAARHPAPVPHRAGARGDEVRVDIYPDGGMARVRLWGELSAGGRETLACAGTTRFRCRTPARCS